MKGSDLVTALRDISGKVHAEDRYAALLPTNIHPPRTQSFPTLTRSTNIKTGRSFQALRLTARLPYTSRALSPLATRRIVPLPRCSQLALSGRTVCGNHGRQPFRSCPWLAPGVARRGGAGGVYAGK